MSLKIGVITHSAQMEEEYSAHTNEKDCEFIYQVGVLQNSITIAHEMQNNHGVDAIITHPATSRFIEDQITVPIIPLYLKSFDIVSALCQAREIGKKPAYVEIETLNRHYDFQAIVQMLQIDANVYQFEGFEQIPTMIKKIEEDGRDVVVSMGVSTIALAKSHKLKTVSHNPEIATFHSAINEIKSIYKERNKEIENSKWLNSVINETLDGILALDKHGDIVVINDAAQNILGLSVPKRSLIRKNIETLRSKTPLFDKIVNAGEEFDIINHAGNEYIFNKQDYSSDSVNIGCVIKIHELKKIQNLEMSVRKKKSESGFIATHTFADIKGKSKCIMAAKRTAQMISLADSNVLISGESGSGKEVFAQSIHNNSHYKDGPFVAINCTTFTDALLESELFGYEDGSFTGAKKGGKAGLFELAHGGTLFLDEIGDMPINLQVKLLRVLEERSVRRIGGEKNIQLDIRYIFATHRDLGEEVKKGNFRDDLYYRINVLSLRVPPLRERKEDIPLIAESITAQITQRRGTHYFFPNNCIDTLKKYNWYGNVRELSNFIERLIALRLYDCEAISNMIEGMIAEHSGEIVPPSIVDSNHLIVPINTLRNMENDIIKGLYERYDHNKKKVEQILMVSSTTLWRRFKEID